jgi:hypothetical protein
MSKGKSGWRNAVDPILRFALHEISLYFWVRGARWMIEKKLNLPHLSAEDLDEEDDLKNHAGTRISTNDIIAGFQEEQGWSEDDYSMKALRQIFDKLNNQLPNKPWQC